MVNLVESTEQCLYLHRGKFYAIMHSSATAMLHVTKSGVTFLIEAELSMGRSKEVERSCSGLRLNSSPFWSEGERERESSRPTYSIYQYIVNLRAAILGNRFVVLCNTGFTLCVVIVCVSYCKIKS